MAQVGTDVSRQMEEEFRQVEQAVGRMMLERSAVASCGSSTPSTAAFSVVEATPERIGSTTGTG